MKKILLLIFVSCILFLVSSGITHAEDSTSSADVKKYKITFPIEELGNCEDLASCKTFCADTANNVACVEYAKKKGFYKQPQINKILKTAAIRAYVKSQLGCESEDSCKEICAKSENLEKCKIFAQKFNIKPKIQDTINKLLTKAKDILGCESEDSCKGICQKVENFEKCSEFAKSIGLQGGVKRTGPGGCDSEQSCKAFCSDPNNFESCASYSTSKTKFKGPGGCSSKEGCTKFCQTRPEVCLKYAQYAKSSSPSAQFIADYQKSCQDNPQKCQQNLTEMSDKYCAQFPEKCSVAQRLSVEEKIKYCKDHPQNCLNGLQITATQSATSSTGLIPPRPTSTEDFVKGVHTVRNFFQRILDILFH